MEIDLDGIPEIELSDKDPAQERAKARLESFFDGNREGVYYLRQLAVMNEDEFFHWVTHRALMDLIDSGFLISETRALRTGGEIRLFWHNRYRYYKRSAKRVVELVEELSRPATGIALGQNAELLVLEGFAKNEFVLKGRNARKYGGKEWRRTAHDLDLILEKDSLGYGVEVKNKLGYIQDEEFRIKIEMCHFLGLRPVFVARMLPKTWIFDLMKKGGFALIIKYQLFPVAIKDLADRLAVELKLPTGAPRALEEGTMKRFVDWHEKNAKIV